MDRKERSLNAGKGFYAMERYGYGADVGGTSVKLGLFSDQGRLVDKWEIPTDRGDGGSRILPDIAGAIAQNMAAHGLEPTSLLGIGVGVPGPVSDLRVVHHCVNLNWDTDVDVAGELSALTGLPVWAGNDANLAALGEMWQGGGKGHRNVALLTLGTGVGGGIIVDGKIISGGNGAAGEVGHIPLNPNETVPCPCGNYGCLEQYASATGVVRMAREELERSDEPSALRQCRPLTAKDVWDCHGRGDPLAARVVERFASCLGRGAAAVACVADPDVFVLGGGMSRAGQVVADVTVPHYRKHAFHASKHTPFVLAQLGNDAGIYGCMRLVLDNISPERPD